MTLSCTYQCEILLSCLISTLSRTSVCVTPLLIFYNTLTNISGFGLPGFTKFACWLDVNAYVRKILSPTWLEISLFFGSSLECWQPLSLHSTFVFLRRCVSKNEWLKYIGDISRGQEGGTRDECSFHSRRASLHIVRDTCKNRILSIGRAAREDGKMERRWRKRLTEGSERRIDATGASGPRAVRLNWHHLWLRFYIWQCDSRECLTQLDWGQQLLLMQPLRRDIKHTCAPSRARKGVRSAALCGFSGQGSGSWRACFRTATLVPRPAAPASLCGPDVQFWWCRIPAWSGALKHGGENQRSSLSFSCFPLW